MENYRAILESLSSFFFRNGNIIELGNPDDDSIKDMMKTVIALIELHTNLDLYNEFTDLYE